MSVTLPLTGVLQDPRPILLATTGATDIVSFAAGDTATRTVICISIVNADASARQVTVFWTKGTTDTPIFTGLVAAGSSVVNALDAPIRMFSKGEARKIRAQAAVANQVTVTVFYTESMGAQSGIN